MFGLNEGRWKWTVSKDCLGRESKGARVHTIPNPLQVPRHLNSTLYFVFRELFRMDAWYFSLQSHWSVQSQESRSYRDGACLMAAIVRPTYFTQDRISRYTKSGLEKARKSGSLSTGLLNNISRASDQSCRLTSRVCTVSSKSTGRNALRGDYCVSEDHYCSKQRSSQGRGTSSRILVYTRRYQRNSGYVMQLSESARPAYRQSRDPDTVD